MTEKQDMGVVTQADIDRANEWRMAFMGNGDSFGQQALHELAEDFARHRLASQADQGEALREAQIKTVAEKLAAFTGAPYEDWRHFTVEAGHILDRLASLQPVPRPSDGGLS